jgi:hypothetical protein
LFKDMVFLALATTDVCVKPIRSNYYVFRKARVEHRVGEEWSSMLSCRR